MEKQYEGLLAWGETEFTSLAQSSLPTEKKIKEKFNCFKQDIDRHVEQYQQATLTSLCDQKHAYGDLKQTVIGKGMKLEAMQNIYEQNCDYRGMCQLYNAEMKELEELQQEYGDISVVDSMLEGYMKIFQFKITSMENVHEDPNISRITILFFVHGKLDMNFPVQIDINVITKRIIYIQTDIYPSEKLLAWINNNNVTVYGVIQRLQQTFLTNFNCKKYQL